MTRSYLFLQGVSSPFFAQLGKRLRQEGHKITKVNFTGGDAFYWRGAAVSFRKNSLSLPEFYSILFDKLDHCTDIIMFGDCRPVHATILAVARERGKRIHVFEEGYFRPYWVTLERNGVNGASELPKDPEWYRDVGKSVPHYHNGASFSSSFFIRAWHDIQYHAWSAWNPVLYPGYKTHAPYSAPVEYLGYVKRAAKNVFRRARDTLSIKNLLESNKPFYFLPLQLDSDAQIRNHSDFDGMQEVLGTVIRSFALFAPTDCILLIKNHPLDPGLIDYEQFIKSLEKHYAVEGRVLFVETGHLPTILDCTRGVVTVNSTVGASALVHKRPVKALGSPIYNLRGLTFSGTLDDFWTDMGHPDMSLFAQFRNTVIHTTQVNGGFYSRQGIDMAVNNSVLNLTEDLSPLDRLRRDLRF